MNPLLKSALAGVALLGLLLPARATVIAYEGFNYPPGASGLNSQNGGTGWSGNWGTRNSAIVAGGFNYQDALGNRLVTTGNRASTVVNGAGNFRSLSTLIGFIHFRP